MKKLMDPGFIKKLKELPKNIQDKINSDFKHFIPTTVAFKETSANTKVRICWNSSLQSKESSSLNSVLLRAAFSTAW